MEFERVKNVIVDQLSVDADEVTLEASFVDDLGADSWTLLNLSWVLKQNLISKSLMKMLKRSAQ